jgi:hypothetical protein
MKITLLLNYPDYAAPEFAPGLELHGGLVEIVQFSDLFQEHENLEPYVKHKISCECDQDDDHDDPNCDCGLFAASQLVRP